MNCRKCGNAIGAGLMFCTKCGTPVEAAPPAASEPAPAPTAPVAASAAPDCPRCGALLKPGMRFCTACGARIDIAPPPSARPDEKTAQVEILAPPPPESVPAAPTAKNAPVVPPATGDPAPSKGVPGLQPAKSAQPEPSVASAPEAPPAKSAPEAPREKSVREAAPVEEPSKGAHAKPAAAAKPPAVKPVTSGPRCPECGAAMMPTSRVCFACGARVGQAKPAAPAPPEQSPAETVKTPKADGPAKPTPAAATAKPVEPAKPVVDPKPAAEVKSAAVNAVAEPKPTAEANVAAAAAAAAAPPTSRPAAAAASTTGDPAKPAIERKPAAEAKAHAEPKPDAQANPVPEEKNAVAATAPAAILPAAVASSTTIDPVKKVATPEAEKQNVAPAGKQIEAPALVETKTIHKPAAALPPRETAFSKPAGASRPGGVSPKDAPSVCGRCGTGLRPGLKFCTRCGAPVSAEAPEGVTSTAGASVGASPTEKTDGLDGNRARSASSGESSEVPHAGGAPAGSEASADEPQAGGATKEPGICPACGAQLSPGVRFCVSCGAAAVAQTADGAAATTAETGHEPETPHSAVPLESRPDPLASAQEPGIETVDLAAAMAISPAEVTEPAAGGSDTVVCAKCGMPATAGVRFCIGCGEPVEWWRAGGTGSHANRRLSASAPTAIKKKGIPAGVLVAIFLVLLLVLAGCAFWLWRSMVFSPSTDVATTQIPEDPAGGAEPANNDNDASALTAEDEGEPVGLAGDASGASTGNDARGESASAVGSSLAGGATANEPRGSTSGGSPPAASRKSATTPAATTKAVQTARTTAPAPPSPVPFVDDPAPTNSRPTTPSSGAATSPPPATAVTQPAPTPVQPTAPAAPTEGIIYWSGKLQRNKRFIISTKGTDYGFADGKMLPGTPVEIRVLSPAVRVVEAPGPNNSWQRVILECTRNTNQSVTINVQWFAAR